MKKTILRSYASSSSNSPVHDVDDMEINSVVAASNSGSENLIADTPIDPNDIRNLPKEMHVTIVEKSDVPTLMLIRKLSTRYWYNLATTELFKRRSPQAIAAQKSILSYQLNLFLNSQSLTESLFFKLVQNGDISLRSLYFTKNHLSPDSALRALTAAALLLLDTHRGNTLPALERAQLRRDILLTALDPSAYKQTLLAVMILVGKDQFLAGALAGIKNLLATSKLVAEEDEEEEEDESAIFDRMRPLEISACQSLKYLGPYLNEAQLTDLIHHFTLMLTDIDYHCRLACEAFKAIAAQIPASMVGQIVSALQYEMLDREDVDEEALPVICLFTPRLGPEDFERVLVILQQQLAQEITSGQGRSATPLKKIIAAASKEQLQGNIPLLKQILFSTLGGPAGDNRATGCAILQKLMLDHQLFSREECDVFVRLLLNIIAKNANNANIGRRFITQYNAVYNALAASALDASPELLQAAITAFKAIIGSQEFHPTASAGLRSLAPRMDQAQLQEIMTACELQLANHTRPQYGCAIITMDKLAPYLKKETVANRITTLCHDLVNPLLPPPTIANQAADGSQEILQTCKRLMPMVHHTPVDQRLTVRDALILRMTHPNPVVRVLASQSAAALIALHCSKEELQPLFNAFIERLADIHPPVVTKAITALTGFAAQISAEELAAIISRMLQLNLICHQDSKITNASAEFFLAFAKRVPAQLLPDVYAGLLRSSAQYAFSLNEPFILYPNKDNKAHQALIELLLNFTNTQLTAFIQLVISDLAFETPPEGINDPTSRARIIITLLRLDAIITLIERVPQIPSIDALMNALIAKADRLNYLEISSSVIYAFHQLLSHVPTDQLPLYIPVILRHANRMMSLHFNQFIINLTHRLTNYELEAFIEPLRHKLEETLVTEDFFRPGMCNALFALKCRIPDAQLWPDEVWTNPNPNAVHKQKFPLLFQILFNEYQQSVNELTTQRERDVTAATKKSRTS